MATNYSYVSFVVISAIGLATSAASAESTGVGIVIDRTRGGFVYRVDSKEVPPAALLNVFGTKMVNVAARNRPITVLLHEEAPFLMLLDVRDRLDKVGFLNVRYYYYGRGKRMMAEIGLDSRAIPYSENGAAPGAVK